MIRRSELFRVFLLLRSAAFLMLGSVISEKGEVLLTPRNMTIFSPPAIKLTSAAGAFAAILISPAANIWVTSAPPLTKIGLKPTQLKRMLRQGPPESSGGV